jgi:hypothetical protein
MVRRLKKIFDIKHWRDLDRLITIKNAHQIHPNRSNTNHGKQKKRKELMSPHTPITERKICKEIMSPCP